MAKSQRGEITDGRRLRLDRRKAGLSQEQLAAVLGCEQQDVSEMENNKRPASPAAKAFMANVPARVPFAEQPPVEPPPPPADAPAPGDGPGPRVESDKPPRAKEGPKVPVPIDPGDLADLERALLVFFAGESFLVPREQPDGTVIQQEAIIPGVAQFVGMADEFDGQMIRIYAPGMARAWAQLARENETVRKVLYGLTYGGAWRGVAAATLPLCMALAAHHGLLPLGGGPHRTVEGQARQPEPPPEATPPNGDGPVGPEGFIIHQHDPAPAQHEPPPTFTAEP